MFDLDPIARQVGAVISGVRDDQLDTETPCPRYDVATLLEHIRGLTYAFTEAATKTGSTADGPPRPQRENLPDDWQEALPAALVELATAWQDPAAWEGVTAAGGIEMPAEVAGTVALNELVVHGWDLARSTNQPFRPDDPTLQVSFEFVLASVDDPGSRDGGLFGPVFDVGEDAPLLAQVIGLSGRDPSWRPGD